MPSRTRFVVCCLLSFSTAGASQALTRSVPFAASEATDGAHDFDFFVGRWSVTHHKLRQRLVHAQDWQDFRGITIGRPLLDGRGNMDEDLIDGVSGGYAFRIYDPHTRLWSNYWVDKDRGQPSAPLVGRFDGGVGTFYGDDRLDGKPIRVRFTWASLDAEHCRWEQAFSPDGGRSWETNWVMNFTRVAPANDRASNADPVFSIDMR